MQTPIAGLHHITAIASDPQRNLDFYTQVLGLRFVKRTVNFDDPGTYHFYFGDDIGSPGTILTFFPWSRMGRGRPGAGETVATAFSIPPSSLPYWRQRLSEKGISVTENLTFGVAHLSFNDPDGLALELVELQEAFYPLPPRYSDVPVSFAVQGFFGATLLERNLQATAPMLELLGYQRVREEANRYRYAIDGDARGRVLDILVDPNAPAGRLGAGSVHHIAFRTTDDASQKRWQKELGRHVSVTPVQDRTYFHSIYFREPGGVLFEIATDAPGFLIDENSQALGEALRLPPWLESERLSIEARLIRLNLWKPDVAIAVTQ